MDETKRMEGQMIDQEKFFAAQKSEAMRDPNEKFANNSIREKEMEMARVRGEKVVALKAQRETLEAARNRVL